MTKESDIQELSRIQNDAKKLYRIPGYLKILNELRKLDPSWSLLISSRGEAARETNVQELSGFYYRATVARPKTNEYCREYEGKGKAYGCIPSFGKKFMGRPLENVFSRRPFMASFESNKFDYTLLTTHVIFTSPTNPESKEHILSAVFGTDDLKTLGTGINQANYARFAEVKVILEFMDKIRSKYSEKDVMLVGDFNIEAKNKFWPEVLPSFPGGQVFVEDATSLKSTLIGKNGEEISGYSKNYDHFLFDSKKTNECKGAQRYDYFRREISEFVTKEYLALPVTDAPYFNMEIDKKKMKKIVNKWKMKIAQQKVIKRNKIIDQSSDKKDKIIENLKKRVFDSQLDDSKVLKIYKEVISDHAPIEIFCNTSRDDD